MTSELGRFDLRLWLATIVGGVLPPDSGVRIRAWLLRFAGAEIGPATIIGGRFRISGGSATNLTIGSRSFVNDGARFDTSAAITLGDGVYVAHDVAFVTSTHEVGDRNRRAGLGYALPIDVGNGSWIAARAVILPGIVIGPGSIVAAGAVVTSDVPPDTLVGGVPATTIRRLPPGYEPAHRRTVRALAW